jgi:hypothetical protein
MMQFTATIALGLAPLVVFGGAALLRPAPPVPVKPVATEGVRMIRMDATTFRARWRPMYDVAPATVIHEVGGGDAHSRENTGKPVVAARPSPPAVRIMRRASLRPTDVCARHGLRKVETVRGKWKGWRCRR